MDLYKGRKSISIDEIEHLMRAVSRAEWGCICVKVNNPGQGGFAAITTHFILTPVSVYLKFTIHLLAPRTFDSVFLTLEPLNAHLFTYLSPG